ncbi:MAG: tRNA (N(6)-L-threonylcarbamoyladenosine(37)-C(2))-methylthiotransferase MtaB [Clostridia bacterium]
MNKTYEEVNLYISTLGCKVNQSESNAIANYLINQGATLTDEIKANIIIVNSCAVTVQAASKTRHELRRLRKANTTALLIFMGCYVEQNEIEEDIFELADVLIGTSNKEIIYDVINEYFCSDSQIDFKDLSKKKRYGFSELIGVADSNRTRAQVRIQDGCENYCTYCIIPYLRGPERSRKKENIIEEIMSLEKIGYKEIVLTGIHLGSYGNDFDFDYDLSALLKDLLIHTKIPRIRLSSIEPNEITEELVELFKNHDRLMSHLHIPLQSGSDKILKKMNRKYTTNEYRELIKMLRQNIEGIAITTDLIIGFPGETNKDFEDIYNYVKDINFSQMHVFRYSKREGTAAASMPDQVDGNISKERSKKIRELEKIMSESYTSNMLGETYNVLIEQKINSSEFFGHSENYAKVIVQQENLITNKIYKVKIISNSPYSVKGVMV